MDYKKLAIQELSRRKHLHFLRYTWPYSSIKFISGVHTTEICEEIDIAMAKLKNGESTFLSIKVPFRHHKSQTVTRSLPPHFIAEFPEGEAIITSYSSDLSEGFSRDARNILISKEFAELYPNTKLSDEVSSVSCWGTKTILNDKTFIGKTTWTGLEGSVTGKGGQLIIVDDFLKGRNDAESDRKRETIWQSFSNDIMTRRSDPCIVIVLATPWHTDDIFGRIKKEMEKDSFFPRFKEIKYPARSKKYPTGYLFPEKFSKQWYESQYATLGAYNASGLLDCDPEAREGKFLPCEEGVNWHYVNGKPSGFGRFVRGWDLASSKKERTKDDPDWTIGLKGSVMVEYITAMNDQNKEFKNARIHVYIEDIQRLQEEADMRNKRIKTTAISDGTGCLQAIEAFGPYKDAYTQIAKELKGIRSVVKLNLSGDKVVKASSYIEVPLRDGIVYVNSRIPKNILNEFWSVMKGFPLASHDDDVDALVVMVAGCLEYSGLKFGGLL